jgi:hypothetical protein
VNRRHRAAFVVAAALMGATLGLPTSAANASRPDTADQLSGVACPASDDCLAVGFSSLAETAEDPTYTLAEQWVGGSWNVQSTGSLEGTLSGISCGTATVCMAVGDTITSDYYGTTAPLAEEWNGTAWTVVPTPSPAGSSSAALGAVSCNSSTFCLAVGSSYDNASSAGATLAEEWNGDAWKIVSTPSCSGTSCYFTALSCASATNCMVVGGGTPYLWNGTTWKSEPAASSAYAVSCPKVNFCMAVPSPQVWNGTSWSVLTPPAGSVSLNAVSCSSASLCTAVGLAPNPKRGKEVPVAEHWGGTSWALQTLPYPKAYYVIDPTAVKCRGSEPCMAVGYVQHGPGDFPTIKTLAELWDGSAWAIQNSPNP